ARELKDRFASAKEMREALVAAVPQALDEDAPQHLATFIQQLFDVEYAGDQRRLVEFAAIEVEPVPRPRRNRVPTQPEVTPTEDSTQTVTMTASIAAARAAVQANAAPPSREASTDTAVGLPGLELRFVDEGQPNVPWKEEKEEE